MSVNVLQKVKKQLDQAASANRSHIYTKPRAAKKEANEEGLLLWIGETDTPSRDPRVVNKLNRGEKIQVTAEEKKLFARTPYERGFHEYMYEGQVRKVKEANDPTDPRHSVREGDGQMWYPHGSLYEGRWKHNKRHGTGCFSAHSGYKYTGEYTADVAEGKGYEVFSNKVAIDGTYHNGVPEGSGVMLYNPAVNTYRYEGEWHNGHRHGKGVIFYANGDTFEGGFVEGKRHGRGITTRTVNGKDVQYETEWTENKLVGAPRMIAKVFRTNKPVSMIPYSRNGSLIAVDITKWNIKADTLDLPFEHFIRLKLGFERLDAVGCGMLPMPELEAVWPESNIDMLEKLDVEGKGYVTLQDLFTCWYPNITAHNISRFMREHIHPLELLRLRGFLNGVEDADCCGYYHVCNDASPIHEDGDAYPVLHLRQLAASQYKIGGEKFTAANYATAKQLSDPPHFLEILEVWYPNIMRMILEHYEINIIDREEIESIRGDFLRYARPVRGRTGSVSPAAAAVAISDSSQIPALELEDFEKAEQKYQQMLAMSYEMDIIGATSASPRTTRPSSPVLSAHGLPMIGDTPVEHGMQPGLFRGLAQWSLGGRIRVTVNLLKEVETFHVRTPGRVSLDELLRFCYPNVPCLRTQEALLGSATEQPCGCCICTAMTI